MFGSEVLRVIEDIREVSSTKSKTAKLKKAKELPLLKETLYYALSKRKKFYIKDLSGLEIDSHNENPTKELIDVFPLLDLLSTGEYRGQKGKDMINELAKELDSDSNILLKRILLKDLRFSMGTTLINGVFSELIEKTPYMGCVPFSKKHTEKLFDTSEAVVSEVKMDGQYINAIVTYEGIKFESRQGEENFFPNAKFVEELNVIRENHEDYEFVLNGELTLDGESNRHVANGIVRSLVDYYSKLETRTEKENETKLKKFIKEKGAKPEDFLDRLVFTIWDIIKYEEYINKSSLTTRVKRLEMLTRLVFSTDNTRLKLIEFKAVSNIDEAMEHYFEIVRSGGEGTVLKDRDGIWKNGKPTWQIKVKTEMTFDLEIIGFNYGTNKNEGIISSLQVRSSDGLLNTQPTGMPESLMADLTESPDSYLGKIVEVKCNGISQNSKGEYSVAHPVVLHIREDKSEANSLDECIEISNSVING